MHLLEFVGDPRKFATFPYPFPLASRRGAGGGAPPRPAPAGRALLRHHGRQVVLAGRRVGAHSVALLARADDVQASVAVRDFSPFRTSWTSSGVRVISTRRFSAFPSGVSLLETGWKGP